MRNLQSEGLMQNTDDMKTHHNSHQNIGSKSIIVSQKRHARGRPRLSLSCMDMYKAANSRCEQPPSSLYHRAKSSSSSPLPQYLSIPPITSSRGPPGCPRLPDVFVPPQEPKSECCARSQHLRRNHVATSQPCVSRNLPGVRLEPVANNAESDGAEEAVVEDVLPALLLRLLAGLDAEEPAGWGVVVVAVCVAAPARGSGGDLSLL